MNQKRKLAAIMFTDIVGYSALMSKDEMLAMSILKKNKNIHQSAILKFNGEYIKEIGDGNLAIFNSSYEAVNCAIEIQKACCKSPTLSIRIGIHIGDIIFKDDDVFGDGVNIASRIESAGEPGRIYFSERVYEDIKNKSNIHVVYIGKKRLKNTFLPVKVFALQKVGRSLPKKPGRKSKKSAELKKQKYTVLIGLTIMGVLLIALTLNYFKTKSILKLNDDLIAVAIFENLTGDDSLDPVGRMASDWITQKIAETGLVSVVPSIALEKIDNIHQNMDGIRSLAKETNAGTIITGVFYKQGDNLQYYVHIVDAMMGVVLSAIGPINGSANDPSVQIDITRQKVMGALAAHFDEQFKLYSDRTLKPPLFEAYKEFIIGTNFFFKYDYYDAIHHYEKSSEIDTTFLLPMLWVVQSYCKLRNYFAVDTLLQKLNLQRRKFTVSEQYLLNFLNAYHQGDLEGTLKASRLGAEFYPILKFQYCYDAILANHPREAIDALLALEAGNLHYEGVYWELRGMAYHMLGEYKKELKSAKIARNKHPELFITFWSELKALAALGEIEEINILFAESLDLPKSADWSPGTPGWLMFITARELRAHGYTEEAKKTIEKSIEWYISHPADNHGFHLAQAYYVANKWDKSKEIIEILIDENHDNFDYLAYSGLIAAHQRDREKAEEISRLLAKIDPLPVKGRSTCYRARIAAVLGEKEKAVQLLHNTFSQGFNSWHFDIYIPELQDFESLKDYFPFQELFKPKG